MTLCPPPADIRVDPHFAALIPPLAPGERAKLHDSLRADGCRDALLVWPCDDISLLVDGHNRFAFCRQHAIPFRVAARAFADRDAVERYIVQTQLERRNLTAEAASYLRGKRYVGERLRQGRPLGRKGKTSQNEMLSTAEHLAREYRVSVATIHRDGGFARAVDVLAQHGGPQARAAILARDCGLRRGTAVRLSKEPVHEQQRVIDLLLQCGKLPRTITDEPRTITLPVQPQAFAAKLLERLGAQRGLAVLGALTEQLAAAVPVG
jgi:hypothetical protein